MCPWLLLARFSGSSQPFILDIYCRLRSFFGGSTCPWGLVAFVWVIPGEGELGIQTFMFVVCPGVEELVVIIYRDS